MVDSPDFGRRACIVGHFGASDESASGARVAAYAQGLAAFDFGTDVISCSRVDVGGANERRAGGVIRHQTDSGTSTTVSLFSSHSGDSSEHSWPRRIYARFARLCAFWAEVLRWLRKTPSGMLVLYGHDGSMLVGAAALGRTFRRTVIVDVTEWFDQSSRRTMGAWLLDFIARRIVPQLATHASVISEEAARHLPRALPRTVVTSMVSHEWAEAIARAGNRERDHGHFMCVFSGSERRGIENLIRALETLALRHAETNFELRLTGNPSASREVDLSTVKRLRVQRTGMLKRSEYAALLKEADCLIIPGDSGTDKDNAFPNRLPEYLLSGKPTVLAGYPAAARRLRHAVEALLLPSSDPTLLVEAIEHLLLDVESATTMGNAGLEAAQRLFDPKTVLKPLVDDLFRIDR